MKAFLKVALILGPGVFFIVATAGLTAYALSENTEAHQRIDAYAESVYWRYACWREGHEYDPVNIC